jgi:putative PEP-CTERM system TPR-repeat lipoprotein
MIPRNSSTPLRASAFLFLAGLLGSAVSAQAADSLAEARSYLASGDKKAAVIELKNALQQDPGNATARLLLGETYLRLGEGASAEKELRRAGDLGAAPKTWQLNLAEALLLQGKFSDALNALDAAKAPADKGDQARALALRGRAELGLRHLPEAEKAFDAALKLDANNREAGRGKIQLAFAKGDFDAAAGAADSFLARFPKDEAALLLRAELYRRKGDMKQAAGRFEQVTKLDPNNIQALLGHAVTMIGLRNLKAATADLDRADAIRKDTPMSHYLRGVIDFEQKDWQKAAEQLQRVLAVSPNHLQSQLLMGIISFAQGNLQLAEEYLSRAVAAMPDNAQAAKVLAATRIKLHEPQQAIDVLQPLAAKTKDAQLMALLGSAYMLKGDQTEGQEWLSRAVDAAPDVAALRTQLALTMLAGGETNKAISELQSAVDLGQGVLQADVLLVLAHLKNKQFDEAIKTSEALEKRMPDKAIPYNLTGLALLAKGETDKAAERFEKALAVDPKFITADLNLARIAVAKNDLEGAQKRYQEVLKQQPGQLVAMLGLAALAERRGDSAGMLSWLEKARDANPQDAQPGLRLARYYLSHNEPLKALDTANALSSRFQNNPLVLDALGRAQALAGEPANAVSTFEQLAQLRPNDPEVFYLMGGAKWKAGDLSGARAAFSKAVELKQDFVNARVALASLALKDGRAKEALDLAKQLQRDFPKSPLGYQLEGAVRLAQKEPGDAVTAFAAAYERDKSSPAALRLAQAYARDDRRKDAIEVLKGWLSGHPKDMAAWGLIALYYQLNGSNPDAIKAYEKVVQADPKNVVMLNNLAWLYQEQGDPRALETARKAYDLDPNKPEVADTYGWILLKRGKGQQGLPILQQAYVSYPTQPEIGYHVAVGLSQLGRKDEAVKVLTRLLRENENFDQAKDAKALLEKLKKG